VEQREILSNDRTVQTDRDHDVHVLACVECPRVSSITARGWKAYRTDEPGEDEPPGLAFYCPECARREFAKE
jgi:hypothetical protein